MPLLSYVTRRLRERLEGWKRGEEETLSSLFSLSVSITLAAIAGPVSSLFYTLSTSVIVLTVNLVGGWTISRCVVWAPEYPYSKTLDPDNPNLICLCPTPSSYSCFCIIIVLLWLSLLPFLPSMSIYPIPYTKWFFSGWVKTNIVSRFKYTNKQMHKTISQKWKPQHTSGTWR